MAAVKETVPAPVLLMVLLPELAWVISRLVELLEEPVWTSTAPLRVRVGVPEPVPSELLDPLFARKATLVVPPVSETAPEKELATPETVSVPAPVLRSEPLPEMPPESVWTRRRS